MFNCIHEKALLLLQKMDHKLDILLAYIPTRVVQMYSYSSFPVSNIKRLHGQSYVAENKRCPRARVDGTAPVDDPSTFLTAGSG